MRRAKPEMGAYNDPDLMRGAERRKRDHGHCDARIAELELWQREAVPHLTGITVNRLPPAKEKADAMRLLAEAGRGAG